MWLCPPSRPHSLLAQGLPGAVRWPIEVRVVAGQSSVVVPILAAHALLAQGLGVRRSVRSGWLPGRPSMNGMWMPLAARGVISYRACGKWAPQQLVAAV